MDTITIKVNGDLNIKLAGLEPLLRELHIKRAKANPVSSDDLPAKQKESISDASAFIDEKQLLERL